MTLQTLQTQSYIAKLMFLLFAGAATLVPANASAQITEGNPGGFGEFDGAATELVHNFLVPFFIALCVLGFIWGVYKFFIMGSSDEDKRNEGRQLMLYAFIGFVAIVALWGIVGFLVGAFGFDSTDEGARTVPILPAGASGGGASAAPTSGGHEANP